MSEFRLLFALVGTVLICAFVLECLPTPNDVFHYDEVLKVCR